MRVLVATTAGAGHFGPLVPFARALRAAGHDVAVAAPASFASTVARAELEHLPFPDADPAELGQVFGRLPDLSREEAEATVAREVFGRIDTRAALPGTRAIVDDWRPDLVLREPCEFSSFLVAEERALPVANVGIGLAGFESAFLAHLADPLAELGSRSGVPGLLSAPRLTLLPASFDDDDDDGDARAGSSRYRDDAALARADGLPDWWPEFAAGRPLVYVTFGSVAAGMGAFPDLYLRVLAAVAELPIRVLLTLGEAGDPAALEPVPANVHVERWWPQAAVMPHAAAMVGHGGFGTTLAGLASGTAMVVVPLFSGDQFANAARVAEVGAGITLAGVDAVPDELAPAVQQVLADRGYGDRAGEIAADIAALPSAADAVPLLASIARG